MQFKQNKQQSSRYKPLYHDGADRQICKSISTKEAKIFKNNNNNNFINNYKKSLVSHSFFTYYLKVGLYTTLDYL